MVGDSRSAVMPASGVAARGYAAGHDPKRRRHGFKDIERAGIHAGDMGHQESQGREDEDRCAAHHRLFRFLPPHAQRATAAKVPSRPADCVSPTAAIRRPTLADLPQPGDEGASDNKGRPLFVARTARDALTSR
jgi:hypothetical protein